MIRAHGRWTPTVLHIDAPDMATFEMVLRDAELFWSGESTSDRCTLRMPAEIVEFVFGDVGTLDQFNRKG